MEKQHCSWFVCVLAKQSGCLRFSSDADDVRLTNDCIIIIIISQPISTKRGGKVIETVEESTKFLR